MSRRMAANLRRRGLQLGASAKDAVNAAAGAAATRTIRLAVTGLSRSGKTVLTTQLIHNLLLAPADRGRLPFLEAVADGTLKEARLAPIDGIALFPYRESLEAMNADRPAWPVPTRSLSGARLVLRYRPRNPVVARLTPLGTLNIEIIDYPGEWLLDLSLLRQSFDVWSDSVLKLCRSGPRQALAAAWLAEAEASDAHQTIDDPAVPRRRADALGRLYRQFLAAARETPPGLKLLQPGRFLAEDGMHEPGGEDVLFCPLPVRPPTERALARRLVRTVGKVARLASSPSRSLHAEMERRFERYKAALVEPFYRDYFRRYDRQIVLVDVLTALNTGPEAFADARSALLEVMESFRFGRGSVLARLARGPRGARIDRVLFAATKADHVTHNQHANLERLLEAMVADRAGTIRADGARVGFGVVAAVKSTENILIDYQGRPLSVLRGALKDDPETEVKHYPGQIPARLPERGDWDHGLFNFAQFAPRRRRPWDGEGMPHIHLDKVLEFLIGEKLR